MKILLVDDNPGDVDLISRSLRRSDEGLELEVARDGGLALSLLRVEGGHRLDLVLLDWKLPRKSGLEVLAEIKGDETLRRIPVVVLTSSADDTDAATAYDLGAAACFTKPIGSYDALVGDITRFMRQACPPTRALPRRVVRPEQAPEKEAADLGFLAQLVESSTDAVIGIDLDARITSWNAAARTFFGYSAEEACGRPFHIIFPGERAALLEDQLRSVYDGRVVSDLEVTRVDQSGSTLTVELTVFPVRDRHLRVVGAASIGRDVTQRKLVEDRFKLAVESSPSAMILVDDGGRIVLVNAEAERLFGYQRAELVGQRIDVLVPERFRDAHPSHRAAFRSEPSARAMGAGRDLHALRKDGTEFPVEIGLTPIETDEGFFTLSSVIDISERQQAAERFRLVVESAPNAMLMVDPEGTITMMNAEAERIFGYDRNDLLGRAVDVLVPVRFRGQHPHHRSSFLAAPRRRAMGAGRDLHARRRDGTEFPVEIGLTPLETQNGPKVLCAILDITERKRTEAVLESRKRELERSNAELEQFAYAVSHDLQEPARVIAGFTELLAREHASKLGDEGAVYVEHAHRGAVRMRQLIQDLLAYARVTRRFPDQERVDTSACLQEAMANLALAVAESGAQLVTEELPPVTGVPQRVTELLQNLVANAIKFRRGTPHVRVTGTRRDDQVEIRVEDDGIGLDMDHATRIFEVFERLHTSEEYSGTGIGLAICKRIVESSGGEIWVTANEGPGVTFHFTLPVSDDG